MARMTVERVIEKVTLKLQDGDGSSLVTPESILEALDQCNVEIATVLEIKELATVTRVSLLTGQNSIPLPSDFLKNLVHGYNITTDDHIKIYDSRRLVDRRMSSSSSAGNVITACNDFPNLYYQYTPSADQDADLYYHRVPEDLTIDGEFPAYIPGNFIQNLFFNFAVAQLYDFIEDGIEGEKTNTLHHEDKFEKELEKFKLFIGPDPDDPFVPESHNRNFDFTNE